MQRSTTKRATSNGRAKSYPLRNTQKNVRRSSHTIEPHDTNPHALSYQEFGEMIAAPLRTPSPVKVVAVGNAVYEGTATINDDILHFVNQRLREDFAMPQRLLACRTPQDMYDVYSSFWKTAFVDYQDEMKRLTELGSETFGNAVRAAAPGESDDRTDS